MYIIFHDVADIFVGYEFSHYTPQVRALDKKIKICAVLMDPGPATAPRDFVLSSTTESGTASMFINFSTIQLKTVLYRPSFQLREQTMWDRLLLTWHLPVGLRKLPYCGYCTRQDSSPDSSEPECGESRVCGLMYMECR